MTATRLTLAWIATVLAAVSAQEDSNPVIRVSSRLVAVNVLVKDKRTGARVDNLTAGQFRISDDGRPQTIAQFSVGGQARPLAVALVVEAVPRTTGKTLPLLKSALAPAFQHLRPDDELMVVRMSPGAEIVQDLSSDRNAAAEALEKIAARNEPASSKGGTVTATTANLPSALLLAARHIHALRPASRAAIAVISSDWNYTAIRAMDQTAGQLLAAGATVHGLIRVEGAYVGAFKGVYSIIPKIDYRDQNIAWYSQQTGGEAVKVKDVDFGTAFEQVIGDIAGAYTVAFVPDADRFDDRFHKLAVEVTAPDGRELRVRARNSYYAGLEPPVLSEPAAPAPEPTASAGVYLQLGGAYTRLQEAAGTRFTISGKRGLPGKLAVLQMSLVQIFPGARAVPRISEPRPVLLARQHSEPSFARLARLEEVKGDRWLRVGLFLDRNRQAPALRIARVGDDLFRLTPEADLPPGEYALSLSELAAPVYDFGIAPAH